MWWSSVSRGYRVAWVSGAEKSRHVIQFEVGLEETGGRAGTDKGVSMGSGRVDKGTGGGVAVVAGLGDDDGGRGACRGRMGGFVCTGKEGEVEAVDNGGVGGTAWARISRIGGTGDRDGEDVIEFCLDGNGGAVANEETLSIEFLLETLLPSFSCLCCAPAILWPSHGGAFKRLADPVLVAGLARDALLPVELLRKGIAGEGEPGGRGGVSERPLYV